MFLFFIIFRSQEYFSVIIVNLIGKSLAITGRTSIWDRALISVRGNLLFGRGIEPTVLIVSQLGFRSCHNRYLNELYQGGLLAFSLLLTVLYVVSKQVDKYLYYKPVLVISACLWALFIQMQFETYGISLFFFIFVLVDIPGFTYLIYSSTYKQGYN